MNGGDLGHFSILEKIGEGGMGRVYKARDQRLDRFVAIKMLAEGRGADDDRRARFIQEAKAASALNHPHIITVHEIGEQDGHIFIVMELVEGKPLNEIIPSKGMRLTEAMRIAAQVADALTAAHRAGIVHRDLKPAHIMVDAHGRVKVLDFGLAKLSPILRNAPTGHEITLTFAADPLTSDDGKIVGSVPYMSPEQAEGKPVDARSDIFSFGAVLYEMVTGQRAFRAESMASTLAAVIGNNPPSIGRLSPATPPEVERLISRCLRKDVDRRSQSMADVKLALEELRDESESGTLVRPAARVKAGVRGWVWRAAVAVSVLAVASAAAWFQDTRHTGPNLPGMVRLSPDDGHSYQLPAISADGGFVAYVSNRAGTNQLWLQQVGGGAPIQLTHIDGNVGFPAFFPDGKRIVYVSDSLDKQRSRIEVISTLGGESQVLAEGGSMVNYSPMLSPDGGTLAFFEAGTDGQIRLVTMSSGGGRRQEVQAWRRMSPPYYGRAAWTSDNRHLIFISSTRSQPSEGIDWFIVPLDGSDAQPMGAAHALDAIGMGVGSAPMVIAGDRALFHPTGLKDSAGLWEIDITPGSWRVHGTPRRLTSGTQSDQPYSAAGSGTVAIQVGDDISDLYLLPLSPETGAPMAAVRRLTYDRREKQMSEGTAGDPANSYFGMSVTQNHIDQWRLYAINLATGKQTLAFSLPLASRDFTISPDGRQIAYSMPEGNSFSIRIADVDASTSNTRVLCAGCGVPYQFSPDGHFLLYEPGVRLNDDPARRRTIRLLEVSTGKDKPWIENQSDSIRIATECGAISDSVVLTATTAGTTGPGRGYLVPWKQEAVPRSQWIEMPSADKTGDVARWRASPSGDFFYAFRGPKLMVVSFDRRKRAFSDPREILAPAASQTTPKPGDYIMARAPGLVFSREEASNSGVWLMKLPR
jgi:Tol biopolymer transport system component